MPLRKVMAKTLRLQQKNSYDDLRRKIENSQDIGVTHQYATSAPQNVPQGCNLAQTIRIVGKDNRGRFGKMSALRCVPMPSFSCFVSDRQHKQQSEKTQSQLIRCVRKPRLCTICAAIATLRMAERIWLPCIKKRCESFAAVHEPRSAALLPPSRTRPWRN